MNTTVLTADDISSLALRRILNRANEHRERSAVVASSQRVLGLLFLQQSLRTEFGFAAAAAHLGWHSINARQRSMTAESMTERWEDTLRVMSAYVDVTVARLGRPLTQSTMPELCSPFLNGGDTGDACEHPSQAIIDLFAIEQLMGPIRELSIAICGDLRSRATRSLLNLLARQPPKALLCVSRPQLTTIDVIPEELQGVVEYRDLIDICDADVVYVTGVAHGAIDELERKYLRITRSVLDSLSPDTIVLSPMPVIDEISTGARLDRRVKVLRQSDDGLFVRMALLEELVGDLT